MTQKTARFICPIHTYFTVKKQSNDDKELERNMNEQLIKKEYELINKISDHRKICKQKIIYNFLIVNI